MSVLLRHTDVVAAACDPQVFSSAVSAHLQLPNGLDGSAHTAVRRLVDRYLTPERVADLEPHVRATARELCAGLAAGIQKRPAVLRCDAVGDIGAVFAVRAQIRWLGWSETQEERLLAWMEENRRATRSGSPEETAAVAADFDSIILTEIRPRRAAGAGVPADVTTELIHDTELGRPLRDEEIVSVLRNWTGGDLGSLALSTGVVVEFLAAHPEIQTQLRGGVPEAEFDAILDEILRIDDPFVSNRRVTTCPVKLGDADLPVGARVVLDWTSANRDEELFADPDAFDPAGNSSANLVYGTGPHVCPGRALATMALRVIVSELLAHFSEIALVHEAAPVRSQAPTGGYSAVPVVLTPTAPGTGLP